MSIFVFYDPGTGSIKKLVQCVDTDAVLNVEGNEKYLLVPPSVNASDLTHYVDVESGEIREKALLESTTQAISIGEVASIDLPEPCRVIVEGAGEDMIDVDDGSLEVEFSVPGSYTLSFQMVRHRKPEVVINVQEN